MIFFQKVIKFGITGVISTVVHVGLVWIGVEFMHYSPTFMTLPAFLVALSVSYSLNHYWTFQADGQHNYYFPRFFAVAITGLLLNILIMYSFTHWFLLPYQFALAVIIIVIPASSFLLNHYWTFNVKT